MEAYSTIASIDIGAAYSRCAFGSSESDQGSKETSLSTLQFPTCMLISPVGEFDSFGKNADSKYRELIKSGKHTEWYLFKAFKAHLYDRKINRDSKLTDVNGREFSALSIFKMALEFLVKQIMEQIDSHVASSAIKWVIAVPAVWSQQSKQLVLEAAILAGLPFEQVVIGLDTELAAIYCQKELDLKSGTNFVVCDLGDRSMNLPGFVVRNDKTLEEMEGSLDKVLGFTPISDSIVRFVVDLLGKTVLEKLRTTAPGKFNDLISQFMEQDICAKDEWSFEVPQEVFVIFKEEFKRNLNSKLERFRGGHATISGNNLILKKKMVDELLRVTEESITKHMFNFLQGSNYQNVQNICLVGGQTKQVFLAPLLEKTFPDRIILVPNTSDLAVLKGAIMYGQNELSIPKRRLKFTYGVPQSPVFKIGTHDEEHAHVDEDGVKRCLGCFVVLALKGQLCSANEVLGKSFRPTCSSTTATRIADIYQSSDRSPKYVSDKGCEYLGSASVLMLDKSVASNTDIELNMWFGKPLVVMKAVDNTTKKGYKNVFDCLS